MLGQQQLLVQSYYQGPILENARLLSSAAIRKCLDIIMLWYKKMPGDYQVLALENAWSWSYTMVGNYQILILHYARSLSGPGTIVC